MQSYANTLVTYHGKERKLTQRKGNMKYIMFRLEHPELTRDIPIIFPDILVHESVASRLAPEILKLVHGLEAEVTVVSAGFVTMSTVEVSGESTSLDLKAREEDGRTIEVYDYFHGIVM